VLRRTVAACGLYATAGGLLVWLQIATSQP
jgi:hypothetical protein